MIKTEIQATQASEDEFAMEKSVILLEFLSSCLDNGKHVCFFSPWLIYSGYSTCSVFRKWVWAGWKEPSFQPFDCVDLIRLYIIQKLQQYK